MKYNWMKRVVSFTMTLALCAGFMPMALAEGEHGDIHTPSPDWYSNTDNHWHVCQEGGEHLDESSHTASDWRSVDGTDHNKVCTVCGFQMETGPHSFPDSPTDTVQPTCYQDGKNIYVCSDCGYRKEDKISATGSHVASAEWSSDTAVHWHPCTAAAGCPEHLNEAAHSFGSGEYINNASQHWQICTVCGGESARQTHVDANGDGVCDICKRGDMPKNNITVTFKNGSSTHATQSVTPGSKPSKPSNPSKSSSNCSYSFVGWTTSSTSSAIYTGQSLTTVENVSVSSNITYYAVFRVSASSRNTSIDYNSSSGSTVGSTVRSQINSAFSNITGTSFSAVTFSSVSGTSYGTLYANSGKTSLSSRNYTYSTGGSYPVSSLYFVPSGTSGTYSVTYSAADGNGNSVSGKLYIYTQKSSSSSSTTINYAVKAGKEVVFDSQDFRDALETEYEDYSPRWVEFSTSDTLSSSASGTVYYNYGGSGSVAFTKSSIDDEAFYYSSSSYGKYDLDKVSFVAPSDADSKTITLDYTVYYSSSRYVEGEVKIKVSGGNGSSSGDITYSVSVGSEVEFDVDDFVDIFDEEYDRDYDARWVEFETSDTLSTSSGTVYYNYDKSGEKAFTSSSIDNSKFYCDDSSYGSYHLGKLSFVAPKGATERTVTLDFTVYYSSSRYVEGELTIKIGDGDSDDSDTTITYTVKAGEEKSFSRGDFNDVFQTEYDQTIRWVEFETDNTLSSSNGTVYYDYDGKNEKAFTKSTIDDDAFYYSSSSYGEYPLDEVSFVAGSNFYSTVTLDFRAYYSSSKYVDGKVVIKPAAETYRGDIRYNTTYNTNVQINPNDIARFFNKTYSSATLQYVKLGGVPDSGNLYYNYYSTSKYGVSSRLTLTSSNYAAQSLYFSPSSNSQYSLSELTYVPSSYNCCVTIPFTAYGSNSKSVSGTILISVTLSTMSEVYGPTPKNTAFALPASSINAAVLAATGSSLDSIQLLSLPASSAGTIYVGSGTSTKADTTTLYTYSGSGTKISQLRFVPASGFTGSVEIPYVAYRSGSVAAASGKLCLGVVNSVKKFSDVTSSTWCYKYVEELSDAKVISGYSDSSFKPNNTVTYGAALKLIMLAAGYPEQKPTGANVFSGYLTKARNEGIITRSNVDLTSSITRLQVAQIAASALKLKTTGLSSVKPFTDTSDASVQALNAAGIIEGYFSNGTSTYKPNNSLTRGQISAIVWRMNRMGK